MRESGTPGGPRRFVQQVDVFSPEPRRGNPVAVVVDGEGLTTDAMAAFTRWTNLSEATFLLPPERPRGRLSRAHLHGRGRAALRRPPHAGQLPRLAARRRQSARRRSTSCRSAGRASCPSGGVDGRLAFEAPPLRRLGTRRAGGPERCFGHPAASSRGDIVDSQWVDNGPGWLVIMLASAEAVLAVSPAPAAAGVAAAR